MIRFLIVADDFTGANDTGVQLKKKGIKTYAIYDSKSMKDDDKSYVLDTESRGLTSEDSYNKLRSNLSSIKDRRFDFIYKKVDSTLRGNIASEIKAASEIFGSEAIIFAPAYPENKRKVIDGELLVNGIRVSDTEIAEDPKTPVHESNIKKLLQAGLKKEIVHYNLDEIRKENISIMNGGIYTFDTEIEEDFQYIIKAANESGMKILWCGSAGFANSIINYTLPSKPVLGIIGSVSDVTREQVKFALAKGCSLVKLDMASVLENNDVSSYIDDAVKYIEDGRDTLVVSALKREDYDLTVEKGKGIGLLPEDVSKFTQSILGKITLEVLKSIKISGLFLTGGDTAIGVMKSLQANSAEILFELMPGIPLIRINGGMCENLKAVTKAGAFGNSDALYYSIRKLKEDII